MNKLKSTKAITLIALVITIIILLILAGISISALTQTGLFGKAKKAKVEAERTRALEELRLLVMEVQTDKKGNATLRDVIEKLKNDVDNEYEVSEKIATLIGEIPDINDDTTEIYVEYKGYQFKIDGNMNVEFVKNGEKKKYCKIKYQIGEGISIDNLVTKVECNTSYKTTLTVKTGYAIKNIVVKMGENEINVDKEQGVINIDNVDSDVEIIIDTSKLDFEDIINKNIDFTGDNCEKGSIKVGENLYIKIKSKNGNIQSIEPSIPFKVSENGNYKFKINVEYDGKIIELERNVLVNQFMTQQTLGFVKYNAGKWEKNQIDELDSLYNINEEHIASDSKNFTFGGFSYNKNNDNSNIVISRNDSVSPEKGKGNPNENGWKILSSYEENGRIYVTKLIHAGAPENFTCMYGTNNAAIAEYILSGGNRDKKFNDYKVRDWNMYMDQNQKDLIESIHIIRYDEAKSLSSNEKRKIGSTYFLLTNGETKTFQTVLEDGSFDYFRSGHCFGIRPVIVMKDGVYIEKGEGTIEEPFVLLSE